MDRLSDWVEQTFGPTLTELFFGPFHEAYTAGLWTRIEPQDAYKSPVDLALVARGAAGHTDDAGYNATFLYPEAGLQALAARMAAGCEIEFGRRAAQVDLRRKEVLFADGGGARFQYLISTLPLNRMLALAGLDIDAETCPATAALALNIGATRGPACPDAHWIYVPKSAAGFHRVGFYSHVDPHFLPREREGRVSLYVERAYPEGQRPTAAEVDGFARAAIAELTAWGMISAADTISPSWVETAYTWSLPGSRWKALAMARLAERGVYMLGRYGRWHFQGIADSVRDGLCAGAAFRGCARER